jgi:hypothetical protein
MATPPGKPRPPKHSASNPPFDVVEDAENRNNRTYPRFPNAQWLGLQMVKKNITKKQKTDVPHRPETNTNPPIKSHSPVPAVVSREPWLIVLSLFLALITYVGLAYLLMPSPGKIDASPFIQGYRYYLHPKPQENFCFLFGLVCIAILPWGWYWLLSRFNRRYDAAFSWAGTSSAAQLLNAFIIAGVLIWLLTLAGFSTIPRAGVFLFVATLVSIGIAMLSRQQIHLSRYIVLALIASLMLMIFTTQLVSDRVALGREDIGKHFDFLLGAANQVWHGQTMLVNSISQYGTIYPYVIAWALFPFGITSQNTVIAFAGLSSLTLFFTYLAIARKTGYGSLTTLWLLICIIGFNSAFFSSGMFDYQCTYICYQCYPLRVVCGVFFSGSSPSISRGQIAG